MRKLLLAALLLFTFTVQAVEVAPRITDREIIESLSELKTGQVENRAEIKVLHGRFDAMEKRFDDMKMETNRRFDDVNRRFESLENLIFVILGMIAGLFGLIVAMFGYLLWDRKSAMKPLEQLRQDVERDLELRHADGSRMQRVIDAFRELAKSDPKVAGILRSFSLL